MIARWVNGALLVALLGSSLLLVNTSYQSRKVYDALDRARKEQLRLDAEYTRLATARQTEAAHEKVSREAAQRLKMIAPPATVYVDAPASALAQRPGATGAPPGRAVGSTGAADALALAPSRAPASPRPSGAGVPGAQPR